MAKAMAAPKAPSASEDSPSTAPLVPPPAAPESLGAVDPSPGAPAPPRVAGVPPDDLAEALDILNGVVRDLEGYNFKRHDLNANLWGAVTVRARRAYTMFTQRIEAAKAADG